MDIKTNPKDVVIVTTLFLKEDVGSDKKDTDPDNIP